MIHEIGVDLLAQLRAHGVPFDVVDGPDRRPTTTFDRSRIVIEEDRESTESFGAPKAPGQNPVIRWTRTMSCRLTIYAKSNAKGAMYWEHRRLCEHILDQVLIGLYNLAKVRKNIVTLKSGKFIDPPDLEKSETPGGAVYVLFFNFDRGVPDVTWAGAAAPTTVISPQMLGAPALTFAAAGHTITRSTGSFLLDGFAVGQTIIVAGSASNNGTFGPIAALTDTVMTFAAGVVNEGPTSGVTITGNGAVIKSTATANGESVGVTINA